MSLTILTYVLTISKEEEDFLPRSLLSSYERHPNHWGFPPWSSPPGYSL